MSVADAALMMNVLKRPDARDWTSLPYDDRDYLQGLDDGIRGLRIAFSPTLGYAKNVASGGRRRGRRRGARARRRSARTSRRSIPGIADPLEITTGLWFAGAAAIWSGLTPEQQKVVDPDFRAEAELGARYSALDIHRLNLRRGELGSHLRQFMQRFDLIATPTLAVPAFDARPAGHTPMDPEAMLAWTPFSYPFNLSQQPACTIPCGLTTGRPADRPAARRADVRRRAGAARGARLRDGAADPAAAAGAGELSQGLGRLLAVELQPRVDERHGLVEHRDCACPAARRSSAPGGRRARCSGAPADERARRRRRA